MVSAPPLELTQFSTAGGVLPTKSPTNGGDHGHFLPRRTVVRKRIPVSASARLKIMGYDFSRQPKGRHRETLVIKHG